MLRVLDFIFSAFALFVLTPFLLPVGILLRFTGEGKVFYAQTRIGLNGKTFRLLKFATMLENSPNIGAGAITVTNDSRVLPVGRFLRKTKINELPQILNILLGDMSIVGPRPLMSKQFGFYDDAAQKRIASVRPGLTGVGSVIFRDEERFFDVPVTLTKFIEKKFRRQNNCLSYGISTISDFDCISNLS
jgi:lipopolysaccharide/colanic/teichoic acid biosynthesis glycosyltransferase